MRMRLAALAAVLAAALIAGLTTISGPFEARRLKLDQKRYGDLVAIARVLRCDTRKRQDVTLPATLTVDSLRAHCGARAVRADQLVDAETGKPYAYRRLGDRDFSLCATFHDAEKTFRLTAIGVDAASFDPATGCILGRLD